MSLYASLADAKQELNAESTSTADDRIALRYIKSFSRRIDRLFMQRGSNFFAPTLATRSILLDAMNINSYNRTLTLRTPDGVTSPIMSMTAAAINGVALVIGTNVQLFPQNSGPYTALQLMGDTFFSWYDVCSDVWGSRYATVTGIWGYNADYGNAWLSVDTLAAAITTTTATTFTVANVDGDNPLGEAPRISAGNIVQIDSEWMDVVSTDIATNIVTVVRGVNGSTAAVHLIAAPVSVYQVDESIRRAVTRQAAVMYARRGAFDTMMVTNFSTANFPHDILQEVNDLLELFANM